MSPIGIVVSRFCVAAFDIDLLAFPVVATGLPAVAIAASLLCPKADLATLYCFEFVLVAIVAWIFSAGILRNIAGIPSNFYFSPCFAGFVSNSYNCFAA